MGELRLWARPPRERSNSNKKWRVPDLFTAIRLWYFFTNPLSNEEHCFRGCASRRDILGSNCKLIARVRLPLASSHFPHYSSQPAADFFFLFFFVGGCTLGLSRFTRKHANAKATPPKSRFHQTFWIREPEELALATEMGMVYVYFYYFTFSFSFPLFLFSLLSSSSPPSPCPYPETKSSSPPVSCLFLTTNHFNNYFEGDGSILMSCCAIEWGL